MVDNTRPAPAPSTMQVIPLSLARLLEYGRTVHARTSVTTYYRGAAGPETSTFAEVGARAAALAHALHDRADVAVGDRVGSLMPNTTEHLETLLAVGSMGAVFQPLNPHLTADQITHVINHADDRVIVVAAGLIDVLLPLLPHCPGVGTIVFTGAGRHTGTTVGQLRDRLTDLGRPDIRVLDYEECLDGRPTSYPWPELPETAPVAMCYSTGTTGEPKAVVYSHRSVWLHSMNLRTADSFDIRNGESFLCLVPIFHVLSWGVPFAAFMSGTPLVFPGGDASPGHLAHVIEDAMPRKAHGAPTVWTQLIVHYERNPPAKMSLQEIISGGSPVPPALIDAWEERYGVDVVHSWGMTETGPVGTVARPPAGAGGAARRRYRDSQGRVPAGMAIRIVDDSGHVLPANDRSSGEIQVRGNTVTASYHHSPTEDGDGPASVFRGESVAAGHDGADRFTEDGWLRTGDIGTITGDGYLTVQDRQADIIRSGGEWIFSATLENIVMESPLVAEAAVIGIPDEKWGERPLAVVVTGPGVPRTRDTLAAISATVAEKAPLWMVPEYWTIVDGIDRTSVDKFDKKDLRAHQARGDYEVVRLPRHDDAADAGGPADTADPGNTDTAD
jgi:fatty-acyl-CoA synthase